MRALVLVLLSLSLGLVACSKKNNSSATPPPVDGGGGNNPPPNPDPNNPNNTSYNLSADNIVLNKLSHNYFDINLGNDARVGFFQMLHSAFGYRTYLTSRYGVNNSYPYATGETCNDQYLSDVYFKTGLDFVDCFDYTDHLEALADGDIYIDMKLLAGNVVQGDIHSTILYPPPHYYVTQFLIPYQGTVSKKNIDANKFFYEIKIGSQLLIYTRDNTVNPLNRYLTMDFGNKEIGTVQLVLK